MPDASERDLTHAPAETLWALWPADDDRDAEAAFRGHELGAVLRCQLDAPIAALSVAAPGETTAPPSTASLRVRDVLHSANSPPHLLNGLKEFAKACVYAVDHGDGPDGPDGPDGTGDAAHCGSALPADAARVLYFAAIAAARLRGAGRITSLGDDALRDGIEWALGLGWVDGATTALFHRTLATLA